MDDKDRAIASLEARLRALEAIVQAMPKVFSQEVFEAAQVEIERRYFHPLAVSDRVAIGELRELEADALNEIWRQMNDREEYAPPSS